MITDCDILDLFETESGVLELSASSASSCAELESRGWEAWYAEIFGQSFVDVLAKHHREAINWHWNARMAQRRGEKPDYLAYFSIWSRGHMKSTLAKRVAICDACLSINSPETGGYCLYVSGTADKVKGHAKSIESLLSSPKLAEHYPALTRVRRGSAGGSKGWTADFIYTDAGYIFHFIGLDKGVAGANVDDIRPTFIVPDDIDDREDSPPISKRRFNTFTRGVIPTRQKNTLIFFAQNLISRFSVMFQIYKGLARVLTNRFVTHPIPACYNLVTEVKTVNGIPKDIVLSCDPTWDFYDKERIQEEIDSMSLEAFKLECQHEVEESKEGVILKHYNDNVHVISESEFAARFGTRQIPQSWNKYIFNDWARTKSEHHANVAGILASSSHGSPLPGCLFLFHPMSFNAGTEPEDVALRIIKALAPRANINNSLTDWEDLVSSTLTRENFNRFETDTTKMLQMRRQVLSRVIPAYVKPVLQMQNVIGLRMSHEALSARTVYQSVFGLPFEGINPGADGGIDYINNAMRVDYKIPHSFRPEQLGYTRFFIVVPDEKLKYNDYLTPNEIHDHDLIRYQFKNWRYRDAVLSSAGMKEHGVLKMNDDFGNGLMMLFHDGFVSSAPLSEAEKWSEHLNLNFPEFTPEAMRDAENWTGKHMALVLEQQRWEKDNSKNPSEKSDYTDWAKQFGMNEGTSEL